MGHEINKIDENKCFFTKDAAWHRLGRVLETAPSLSEAFDIMHFEQESCPVYYKNSEGEFVKVPNRVGLTRPETKECFDIVSENKYTSLDPRRQFAFFKPFIDKDEAELSAGVVLKGGKHVVLTASLHKTIDITKNDPVHLHLIMANSNTNTKAPSVIISPTRVVCANTLAVAENSSQSKILKLYHRATVNEDLNAIQDCVNIAKGQFEATCEQYQYLATKLLSSEKDLDKYINILWQGSEEKVKELEGRALTRHLNTQNRIKQIFETAPGQDLKSANGSYWGAYNAVTYYLTHEAGKTYNTNGTVKKDDVQNRINSLYFGQNANFNKNSLDLAMQLAS